MQKAVVIVSREELVPLDLMATILEDFLFFADKQGYGLETPEDRGRTITEFLASRPTEDVTDGN